MTRSWLYLGGTLSSAVSILAVMRLGSWLLNGRSRGGGGFVYSLELYGAHNPSISGTIAVLALL